MPAVIRTRRLELVPLGEHLAETIVQTGGTAGLRHAEDYPTDGTLVAAGMVVTAASEGRELGPFTTYQIIRRSDKAVVGDCGFHSAPDTEGAVVVGYGIADSCRGRGYATEALEALIGFALLQHGVRRVIADTSSVNLASRRVMEKAGMRIVREAANVVYFEA